MYKIYVVESREGYRYTGQTDNLKIRLSQHNNGVSKWTRRGTEWKVIYTEEFRTRKEARIRENYLKTGAGRDFLQRILEKDTGL